MSAKKMISTVENDRVLVLERVFNAPRQVVFSMFSEAQHLKHWWGPKGWDLPVCKIDFRPGGTWHYCMKCVDKSQGEYFGMESWGITTYEEIVAPERIVSFDSFADADGNINEELPTTKVTVTFMEQGAQTKVISRSEYATPEALKAVMDMGMLEGVAQTWDRLEERLASL